MAAIDESTPLLPSPVTLPDLKLFYTHVQTLSSDFSSDSIVHDFVSKQELTSELSAKALTLALACYSLSISHPHNLSPSLHPDNLFKLLSSEWNSLLSNYSFQEIEQVLWTSFPVTDNSSSSVGVLTVIDALIRPDIPRSISMHPYIVRSMLLTWKLGNFNTRNSQSVWIDRIDSIATPRILHAIELIYFAAHIGLLTYYVLNPPIAEIQSNPPLDWRAFVLAISALSSVLRRSWRSSLPFTFTIAAFFLALPVSPHPDGLSYMAMLMSVSLHFLQINLPYGPSLVLLAPQSRNLLLSSMLETVISDIFIPVLLFVLPAFLVVSMLLSYSLAEPFIPLSVVIEITPIAARYTFFFIFLIIVIIFICLSLAMVILLPHIRYIRSGEIVAWDGFTVELALQTRRAMLDSVKDYSRPLLIPAPFTLMELLFVTLPTLVLRLFRKGELAAMFKDVYLPSLWRCSVLPFAYLVGALWLWNLRTR